jgi:hypothetical protein
MISSMTPSRTRANILTKTEVESVFIALNKRHQNVLSEENCRETLAVASKKEGLSINATSSALRSRSLQLTGKPVSVQGFRKSRLLHEIADGVPWDSIEKKFGTQMVKTACADFVRQFAPNVIHDKLSGL